MSFDKGCFLGQEAVAKVRNLGHPRRVVIGVEAEATLSAGDPVLIDGEEAGTITSAAVQGGRSVALARVPWRHREGSFTARDGAPLRRRG